MKQYLLIDKTSTKIKCSTNFEAKEDNCRCVEFNSLVVTGDKKPTSASQMHGGKLTIGNKYTKRVVPQKELDDKATINAMAKLNPDDHAEPIKTIIKFLQR